jgi:hypothetical protein
LHGLVPSSGTDRGIGAELNGTGQEARAPWRRCRCPACRGS